MSKWWGNRWTRDAQNEHRLRVRVEWETELRIDIDCWSKVTRYERPSVEWMRQLPNTAILCHTLPNAHLMKYEDPILAMTMAMTLAIVPTVRQPYWTVRSPTVWEQTVGIIVTHIETHCLITANIIIVTLGCTDSALPSQTSVAQYWVKPQWITWL